MSYLSSYAVSDFISHTGAPEIAAMPSRKPFRLTFGRKKPPIIAICHLSWNWVWQRPQQFLSRLGKNHSVFFVETYCTHTHRTFTRTRAAADHPSDC